MEEQIRRIPPPPPPRRPETTPQPAKPSVWGNDSETQTDVNEPQPVEEVKPMEAPSEPKEKKGLNPKLVTGLLIGGAVLCFALMIVFAIQLFS